MWKNLSGYRTHIGMIAGALLTALYGLDQALHDNPATLEVEMGWVSVGTYTMIAGLVAGWTGVAVRAAMTTQAEKVATTVRTANEQLKDQVAISGAATKNAVETQTTKVAAATFATKDAIDSQTVALVDATKKQ